MQWGSQDIADARAQYGHTTFVRNSGQSAEAFGRSGTCSVSVRGELNSMDIHSDTAKRPFSAQFAVLSAPIIHMRTCTGGARAPVARARAPVCPSLATPLASHIFLLMQL